MTKSLLTFCAVGLAALLATGLPARAANVTAYVGYADDLRSSPFFPMPWQGDPNVIFLGGGSPVDAGAFRLDNTGVTDITLTAARVDGFTDGASYQIWDSLIGAGLVVHPGQKAIFTQTLATNFDTSDGAPLATNLLPSIAQPQIHVTLNGTPTLFTDSAQVLNTGGFDRASFPLGTNESLQWRLIGTTGVNDPAGTGMAPEPSSLALLAIGGLPVLAGLRRRRTG